MGFLKDIQNALSGKPKRKRSKKATASRLKAKAKKYSAKARKVKRKRSKRVSAHGALEKTHCYKCNVAHLPSEHKSHGHRAYVRTHYTSVNPRTGEVTKPRKKRAKAKKRK